jgi:hypothetical protein
MLVFAARFLYVWDMDKRRKDRTEYQSWKKGYYHLSTDGWQEGRLFHTIAQYAYGMILIGLLTLLFEVEIYDFSLMPNHIHIILSGTGAACLEAFDYLRMKITKRLIKDGYPPLPKDYWFKVTPIDSEEQMRVNFIYVARNAFEKQLSVPGGYPWGACWLWHSQLGRLIEGTRADSMSKRELERLCGTRTPIPPHWQFHPRLGLLPSSFIKDRLFYKLFPTPKQYETRLIKEYEALVKIGKNLGEEVVFTQEEVHDIIAQELRKSFSGKSMKNLSGEEKGRLCTILNNLYDLTPEQIASALLLQEYVVRQILHSKDYGKKP